MNGCGATAGPATARRIVLTSCLGLTVAIGYARFSAGLYLPHMANDLGISRGAAALLVTSNLAAYLVATFTAARVGARIGLVRLLQLGIALAALAMGGLAIARHVAVAHVAMATAGIGGAFVWMAAAVISADATDEAHRGRTLGWVGTFNGIGVLTSSLLALALADETSMRWRVAWGIQASIGLVVLAASFTIPLSADRRPRGRAATRVGVRRSSVIALAAAYAAFAIGYTVFATYLVGSVGEVGSVRDGPGVWAFVGLGAVPGAMLLGRISDVLGRARTLSLAQFAGALSALLVIVHLRSGALIWPIAGVLFGVLLTGMATLIPAVIADRFTAEQIPEVLTVLTLSLGIAQAMTPVLMSSLLGTHSDSTLYIVAGGAFVIAGVLFGGRGR